MRFAPALASALAVLAPSGLVSGEEPRPAELGLEERVEVRMVLLDVLVLDRQDRTVPDLSLQDFELLVDGKTVPIETLDRQCPAGSADDARAVREDDGPHEAARSTRPGRLVLVFDYDHMISSDPHGSRLPGGALRAAEEAIRSGRLGGGEIMVLSMGSVLRIEEPLTSDRDDVLRALGRMHSDPALSRGPAGLSEFRFFERLEALMDLLEAVPGRKAVVLFSGPLVPDGFTHDPAYARLAAMSATSRASIYPVDTGGLRTLADPDFRPLGGPAELRRLATESGGRMTADTNDLALGLARAERDLGCLYTLGFQDREARLDRSRRVTVLFPGRKGLRAVSSASYGVRSAQEKARSLLETASIAPQSFRSDAVRADLILAGPLSERRWDATFVVEICTDPASLRPSAAERELRAFLRTPSGTTVRSLRRRVAPSESVVLERMSIRPGRYVLSAVVSDPEGGSPVATVREVEVPAIPHAAPLAL